MHKSKPALGFIALTLLLDVLGFGLLIPVGPRLVMHLQGGTEAQAAPVIGGLMATYAAMQFLFAPMLGVLSDRFGRRPVILIALFGSGLDYIAQAFAPTLSLFYITRIINGISGASMPRFFQSSLSTARLLRMASAVATACRASCAVLWLTMFPQTAMTASPMNLSSEP